MPDLTNKIVDELKSLRPGRGLQSAEFHLNPVPLLRKLARASDEDTEADLRAKLSNILRELARPLPRDLRLSAEAALAIDPEVDGESLKRRMEWVATEIDRDNRTVARRINEAFRRMAQEAAARLTTTRAPANDDGWYVEKFHSALRLDSARPEAIENRTIVATAPSLSELVLSTTVPRHPAGHSGDHGLEVEVVYGGVLILREQPSTTNFRAVLALPFPLVRDDRHAYQIITRLPPGQRMQPHYVYVPAGRCDHFQLRVRFALDRLPESVWRLDGVRAWTIEDEPRSSPIIAPDRSGEVQAEFTALKEGRGYGLKWTEPSA